MHGIAAIFLSWIVVSGHTWTFVGRRDLAPLLWALLLVWPLSLVWWLARDEIPVQLSRLSLYAGVLVAAVVATSFVVLAFLEQPPSFGALMGTSIALFIVLLLGAGAASQIGVKDVV
jgi:hypothetical protein